MCFCHGGWGKGGEGEGSQVSPEKAPNKALFGFLGLPTPPPPSPHDAGELLVHSQNPIDDRTLPVAQ